MAKLIALALAFSAFLAIAAAHTTIITTTIDDERPVSRQQCSQQIQGKRFNQCRTYLQQGQSWEDNRSTQMQGGGDLQSCCQELQNVDEQCQCEAVKEAFRQAQTMQQQQQQGQQGGSYGSQQIKQLKQKAQNLPNQCRLQTRQCQIGTLITTIITEEYPQMCQNVRGRRFDQCQSYIQRQTGAIRMIISRKGEQSQGLRQCCDELENVERECQCEAMLEVYRQAQQIQKQGRRQGGRQSQDLEQIVQNLKNQCDLQVEQCRIPSGMF